MTYPTAPPLPLEEEWSQTADATGAMEIYLRPRSSRITWQVTLCTSHVDQPDSMSNPSEPVVVVYNGTQKIASSYTASSDQMGPNCTVRGGYIRASYSNLEPGAVVTFTISGTKTTGR